MLSQSPILTWHILSPKLNMCICESFNPGITVFPSQSIFSSISVVAKISSLVPIALIFLSSTKTASTNFSLST